MCLHLWTFWQKHTWTRLDLLPLNDNAQKSTEPCLKVSFFIPICAGFASSLLRRNKKWTFWRLDVEVDLFQGLYKTQCDLEYGCALNPQ